MNSCSKGIIARKTFIRYFREYRLLTIRNFKFKIKILWFTVNHLGLSCVIFFIEQIFNGNTDPYKTVEVELVKPVYTRYVRLDPQSWEDGVALKLELFGCRPE